jgi:hypothetical protein
LDPAFALLLAVPQSYGANRKKRRSKERRKKKPPRQICRVSMLWVHFHLVLKSGPFERTNLLAARSGMPRGPSQYRGHNEVREN